MRLINSGKFKELNKQLDYISNVIIELLCDDEYCLFDIFLLFILFFWLHFRLLFWLLNFGMKALEIRHETRGMWFKDVRWMNNGWQPIVACLRKGRAECLLLLDDIKAYKNTRDTHTHTQKQNVKRNIFNLFLFYLKIPKRLCEREREV